MDRRRFIVHASSLAVAAPMWADWNATAFAAEPEQVDYPIAIFGKVFQKHSFDQLAEVLEITNADGVEATIRTGGHIDPSKGNYGLQLAKMVTALAKRSKRLLIAATDINEATAENRDLLNALRDNGVKHYRMGYYKYRQGLSMLDQVREFAAKAKELAALNHELGMVGLYQNHAGKDYVGSLLWDLAFVLQGIPVEDMGAALDLRHLRAEIGVSFSTAVNAIRPHLRSVYLKDTQRTGADGQTLKEVPLGEGMVTRELFRDVWKSVAPAPLSVHVEYHGQKPYAPGNDQVVIEANKKDVETLRSWMA